MFMLEISMLGEIDFSLVMILYGFAILIAMCIAMFFIEWLPEKIAERKERKRRNKNRRGYVYIDDRRYR